MKRSTPDQDRSGSSSVEGNGLTFNPASDSIYRHSKTIQDGSRPVQARAESTASNVAIASPRSRYASTTPMGSIGGAISLKQGQGETQDTGGESKPGSLSRMSQLDELRSRYGTPPVQNIPPRQGSPGIKGLPSGSYRAQNSPGPSSVMRSAGWLEAGDKFSGSVPTGGTNLDDFSTEQKAQNLGRHLRRASDDRMSEYAEDNDEVFQADDEDAAQRRKSQMSRSTSKQSNGEGSSKDHAPDPTLYPRSHRTQGGDITNDLYKWQAQVSREKERKGRSRSFGEQELKSSSHEASLTSARDSEKDAVLDIGNIKEPGGMRRNYLHRARAGETTDPIPSQERNEDDYFFQDHHDDLAKRPSQLRSNTAQPETSKHATRFAPLVKTYGTLGAEQSKLSTISGEDHQQVQAGSRRPHISHSQTEPLPQSTVAMRQPRILTKNFIDFLMIYGHFAGEDLGEDDSYSEDDESREDDVESALAEDQSGEDRQEATFRPQRGRLDSTTVDHRTPLIKQSHPQPVHRHLQKSTRHKSSSRPGSVPKMSYRNRSKSAARGEGEKGTASVTQAIMMLLKSFVGTGVLFMGRAFYNGGMGFSMIALTAVAVISLYSFLLLVKTRLKISGGYGEIGGKLYGPWMRSLILSSIALSQIGFVCAYTIFTAETLHSFFLAVTDGRWKIPTVIFILAQLLIFLPLAWVRDLAKLSGTALIADAFILLGLMYLYYYNFWTLARHGVADIEFVNPQNWALFVGTAVFTFEGVGLIIPITESMAQPEKFPKILSGVMLVVMLVFTSAGATSYAAYGSKIETVVILNLPQDDRFVNAVQFLYSIAIMLSTPLQLFPAIRIIENGLFTRSGKYSNKVKWQKNSLRALIVVLATLIAWIGAADLDKFVSLLGSFACVPLCYIFPPLLHYRARADTWSLKAADIALVCFGATVMVFTSIQTLTLIATS